MKSFLKLCALGAFVVVTAAAQPKVTALVNNYGNVLPGLPNYGIAQGSILSSTDQGSPIRQPLCNPFPYRQP
jgi:hypothetical protein